MRCLYSNSFERDYRSLPEDIQTAVDKQLELFFKNPRHPSINLKKMSGHRGIWRGKVSSGYRFTVQIKDDLYIFRRVGPHDVLKNP